MTNPKLEFYTKLLAFFHRKNFSEKLAQVLAEIAKSYCAEITLEGVSLENLKLWHRQYKDESLAGDPGIEKFQEASSCAFADLAPQIKTEAARAILREWILRDDLHVHVRRSKSFGDGFASFTVVTDSEETLREFFKDQSSFNGNVIFSETDSQEGEADEV